MPDTQTAAADDREGLLRLVFDHASEGISVFDQALHLRAFNQHFLQLTRLDPALVRAGVPLIDLLRALAAAGEFGAEHVAEQAEAEAQRRLTVLSSGPASVSERQRPDGRTIELRRSPTPGGGFVMRYTDITERKAAQATLADQQRMLALLIERTEQGIWFIDNALRTTDANPAMCRMLGLTLPQMLGRDIYQFTDEANGRIFRQQVVRRSQGVAQGYEISLLRADVSLVHCYNNATPIFDAAGKKVGAVGMFSDISRLKHAEQQVRLTGDLLAQKTQVLEATLNSLSQGVISIDAQGRCNGFNRRFLELLEIPQAMMQARPSLNDLLDYQSSQGHLSNDPNDPEVALRAHAQRYQRKTRHGGVLQVDTHHAADGSLVRTYTDVTASVQAQEALAESEARFRHMADAAPALIWLSDTQGRGSWFNQRWLGFTGRTLDQELACDWPARTHADDHDSVRAVFEDAASRQASFTWEYRLRCQDGREVWIANHGVPRFGAFGQFEGFTVYGWDITERRAAQAALVAAKEEAERANRAKSDFLSRMSHELRTPLNAVLGFAQLLEADDTDPLSTAQRARVHELMHGGRHLLSLINDVLDLARIEAGSLHLALVPVDVARVLQSCLPLVAAVAAERGIQVTVAASAPETHGVLADATRLKQVLLNLLSNAIKYNRVGGRVEVSWHALDEGSLRIEVSDTGPGLSAAQQERLFHAFERLDAAHTPVQGAGIGLALSKWLVELMHGHIGVHSQPGQGSRFWFSLARASLADAALSGAPVAVQALRRAPLATRQHQVLYIEDNEVNLLLMEGMLAQRGGVQLRVAGLPEQGLALAQAQPPDLVLLDIQLPGIDGFEVLRRLRQQPALRHTPVVAVSANAMPADRLKAEQAGFADYVTKPVDIPALMAVLDRLLPR